MVTSHAHSTEGNMSEEKRKHPRKAACGELQISTEKSDSRHNVFVKDVSKGGAFVFSLNVPAVGEKIGYELLDAYGLVLTAGTGRVIRAIDVNSEALSGFAIQFDQELDQAMLDYLCEVRTGKK